MEDNEQLVVLPEGGDRLNMTPADLLKVCRDLKSTVALLKLAAGAKSVLMRMHSKSKAEKPTRIQVMRKEHFTPGTSFSAT